MSVMQQWMAGIAGALVWCAALAVPAGTAGADEHAGAVRYYAIAAALREVVQAAAPTTKPQVEISFDALDRHFDLELEAAELFAPGARTTWIGDAQQVEESPRQVYLSGRLRGTPGSRVRLSRRGDGLAGVIVTPDEIYFVEPATRRSAKAAAGALAVYRRSDVVPVDLSRCGVQHVPLGATDKRVGDERPRAAAASLRRTEISLVADYEYYRAHGGGSAAAMQDTINLVNAIYEAELGVSLSIANTVVYTTAADPFTRNDANGLLDQFTEYVGSASSPVFGSDLAHLFTGRDVQSNIIGIAWVGTVCGGGYASGLSQDLEPSAAVSVAAHEIGHNFGAAHDPTRCTAPPDGFIMQPSLNCVGRSAFSPRSKSDIGVVVDGAECLDSASGARTPTPSPTRTRVPGTPTATKTRAATRTATPTGPTRTPTATPTFAPSSIGGLVLWLDAGQLGALGDGAAVANWPDASGQRHDARQAAGGARPTYRRAAFNGHSALRFDGADDRLDVDALVAGPQKRTVVIVSRADAIGRGAMVDLGNTARAGGGFAITPEYAARTGSGERVWKESASRAAPSVAVVRLNGTSTAYLAAWVDGRRLAVARSTAARVETAGPTMIGASSLAAGGGAFAGDIAEVLVYNRGLTEGERVRLLIYLGAKYGIAAMAP